MIEEATIYNNNNKVKTIATTNEYQRIVEIAVELVKLRVDIAVEMVALGCRRHR